MSANYLEEENVKDFFNELKKDEDELKEIVEELYAEKVAKQLLFLSPLTTDYHEEDGLSEKGYENVIKIIEFVSQKYKCRRCYNDNVGFPTEFLEMRRFGSEYCSTCEQELKDEASK